MRRAHLYISGIVQGVCFRYYTREYAENLELQGWVRNLRDGRVEVLVEGKSEEVEKLIHWCHKGPSGAKVVNLQRENQNYLGDLNDFSIERDA